MHNGFPKLSTTPGTVRRATPPTISHDNDSFYADVLEMSAGEIADLKARGVI
jgi:crotonobetainyl-CoA:carnitine CoA-transferase CaiB-like acyl-CoA transferase